MTDQKLPLVQLKVKTVELDGEDFIGKYREVISFKEVFYNPMEATVKMVDDAIEFLKEHILEPEDEAEKEKIIRDMTAEQITKLFERI